MSQEKLAENSGVPQTTISSIETGDSKNPGIVTLMNIADALGCGLFDIVKVDA